MSILLSNVYDLCIREVFLEMLETRCRLAIEHRLKNITHVNEDRLGFSRERTKEAADILHDPSYELLCCREDSE